MSEIRELLETHNVHAGYPRERDELINELEQMGLTAADLRPLFKHMERCKIDNIGALFVKYVEMGLLSMEDRIKCAKKSQAHYEPEDIEPGRSIIEENMRELRGE